VLVQAPGGLVLRVLQSDAPTSVNGERISTCTLRDGDVVAVGPFEFDVHLRTDTASVGNLPLGVAALHDMEVLQKEKEALRIQAAAVVAQQAALTEEEGKLQQRAVALQRQEEQLAAHLEEKRGQLVTLQDQVRDARAALRGERTEFEQQSKEMLQNVDKAGKEATATQQQAQTERKRLQELRRRLKQRWHRHWAEERAVMHRREQEVLDERRRLEQAIEQALVEKSALTQTRLRFNGEVELGRRQLQAGRVQLAAEQTSWRERRTREQAALRTQTQALRQRETLLAGIERELLDDKQRWEEQLLHLAKEVEGLENRIRNQRRRMLEQQEEATRLEAKLAALRGAAEPAASEPAPDATPAMLPVPTDPTIVVAQAPRADGAEVERLEILTGELADQRLHLIEQFERLVWIEAGWRQARSVVLAELESAARQLDEREQAVHARERDAKGVEDYLRQRREELGQTRCHLDAWQSRLGARESAWESERATLQARLRTREELVRRHLDIMTNLRRRWGQRRRLETSQLRAEHQRFQEARQQYAALWEDCLRRSAALDKEKRSAAEQTLAMEQYRLELLNQSEDAANVERTLERLRRRWAALAAAAERSLGRQHQALEAEASRVETRSRHVEQLAAEVAAREAHLSKRQTAWEFHQAMDEEDQVRLHKELESLRAERVWRDRQLADLRYEVERMAVALLEEAQPPDLPDAQAA
jgi:hypothetical protein